MVVPTLLQGVRDVVHLVQQPVVIVSLARVHKVLGDCLVVDAEVVDTLEVMYTPPLLTLPLILKLLRKGAEGLGASGEAYGRCKMWSRDSPIPTVESVPGRGR